MKIPCKIARSLEDNERVIRVDLGENGHVSAVVDKEMVSPQGLPSFGEVFDGVVETLEIGASKEYMVLGIVQGEKTIGTGIRFKYPIDKKDWEV